MRGAHAGSSRVAEPLSRCGWTNNGGQSADTLVWNTHADERRLNTKLTVQKRGNRVAPNGGGI
jgi:hypothetical protein